ncbi:replication protein A 70 kDa DNA-binding subunit-like isoform X2 [Odontomachus brunneus]|uniref:replication protein A 70 kDa DNA-binding subunit-like isoform X2 n=1 Tax=Odontomachus brunneus TaxID=486640 RepID=UPI0013F1B138|nr:replication protein A 70 kDa DNA-binding subunit-like isoform X2 [Odontomachus brunneus]
MIELSKGSLDQIMSGQNFENSVLQLLSYKKLRGATSDQYRLVVSDGERINQYTMLSTKLNHLIKNYILNIYTIFKLLNYEVTSMDKERKVLIIMNCEVLTSVREVMCMIGNPTITNKPHSSTAVHHEVMEDTMQSSTSSDTNNSLRVESTVPIITLEDTMQPSTSKNTNNSFRVESNVPFEMEDTMQPNISRDTNNSFRVKSTVEIITLEDTTQPSTSGDINNSSREEPTVPIEMEDTMQPSTSRDTNNSFRVKSTVPIITLEDTMQPSTSKDTNNSFRIESNVPFEMEDTMQPSTSRDTNNSFRIKSTVEIVTLEDTMQPSTSRDTNNSSHEEPTVPIEMKDTMLPSTSRDTNNFSRKEPIVPIKSLSPLNSGTIKARVINKSPIKEWKKYNRSGEWFSTDLVDQDSTKIKCIVFNECDRFHNDLKDNKVYQISKYCLKPKNPKFSKLQNKYEIKLTKSTKIVECYDDGCIQLMLSAQLGGNFDAPLLTFQEATKAKLGENPYSENVFMVVATICSIYKAHFYKACPNDSCKKKKIEQVYKTFKCGKCNQEYINFIYGLRLGDEYTCESITPLKHLIYSRHLMAKINKLRQSKP